jgi:hypothetical protein
MHTDIGGLHGEHSAASTIIDTGLTLTIQGERLADHGRARITARRQFKDGVRRSGIEQGLQGR